MPALYFAKSKFKFMSGSVYTYPLAICSTPVNNIEVGNALENSNGLLWHKVALLRAGLMTQLLLTL